jgi:predicted metal-dependent hydrolase
LLRTIELNGRTVVYDFLRKKVKNINLRIHPNGSIRVSAAKNVPVSAVEAFLRSQSGRILSALERFAAAPPPQLILFADGETFPLLGQPIRIRVLIGTQNRAQLAENELLLTLCEPENAALRARLFQQWNMEMCKTFFDQSCSRMLSLLQGSGVLRPSITVRRMTSRWGSCRPQKQAITLNLRLLEHPAVCIDFVVLHELIHFVHPNHSQAFYRLLSELMPDWRERKRLLES